MKNKADWTSVKGEIDRKVMKSKNVQNLDLFGAGDQEVWKVTILLQKTHPWLNTHCLSHLH